MDPFYFDHDQDAAIDDDYLMSLGLLIPSPAAAPASSPGTAFAAYQRRGGAALLGSMVSRGRQYISGGASGAAAAANVHRRMFGYLRRIGHADSDDAGGASTAPTTVAAIGTTSGAAVAPQQAPLSSRFRHIMRERLRRERLSQGFADLHALLPPGASAKGGKNDIVGAAARYIRELEGARERLRGRNLELMERAEARMEAMARPGGGGMVVKVRAESEDHSTAVEVFHTVLRRLRAMEEELRVTAIRSRFFAGGMWMNVGVEGQAPTREVDRAVRNAMVDLEGNGELGKQDPGSSRRASFRCQVENGAPPTG